MERDDSANLKVQTKEIVIFFLENMTSVIAYLVLIVVFYHRAIIMHGVCELRHNTIASKCGMFGIIEATEEVGFAGSRSAVAKNVLDEAAPCW